MINGLATHLSAWKQKDLADFRNKLQNCVPKRNEDSKINRIYWDEMHHKSSLQVSEEKLGFLTVLSIASKSIKSALMFPSISMIIFRDCLYE